MEYDRYVHIVMREGQIRAVVSRAKAARESLEFMRSNSMPAYNPDEVLEEYMRRCSEEHSKWRLERWPIVNTMKGV